MRIAGGIVPGAVPDLLFEDRAAGALVMAYLEPRRHRLWKEVLRAGEADRSVAGEVGRRLGRIHAATARRPDIAAQFPDRRHLPRHPARALSARDGARAPVAGHGAAAALPAHRHDQARPRPWRRQPEEHPARAGGSGVPRCRMRLVRRPGVRPRLLPQPPAAQVPVDVPDAAPEFLGCFKPGRRRISRGRWEPRERARSARGRLLPALFLARVDGKSPVEYLTDVADKERVRRVAGAFCWRRRIGSPRSRRHGPWSWGCEPDRDRARSWAAVYGIAVADRRSRPRSSWPAVRSAGRSRPPGLRPARARPSTCATAVRPSAAWMSGAP